MTANLPALIEPLTPPECDLRGLEFLPLDVRRFRDSTIVGLEPEGALAAVLLWCVAWHEVPAGSLEDNDGQLCRLVGLGRDLSRWREIRETALRGFVKASDGRLYHRVVCEKALFVWTDRLKARKRSAAGNSARGARFAYDPREIDALLRLAGEHLTRLKPNGNFLTESSRDAERPPTGSRQGAQGKVRKGKVRKKETAANAAAKKAASPKGSRLSPAWFASAEERAYAEAKGFTSTEVGEIEDDFRDYWFGKAGPNAIHIDWTRVWYRWIREERRRRDERGASGVGGGRGKRDPSRRGGLLGAVMEARRARG